MKLINKVNIFRFLLSLVFGSVLVCTFFLIQWLVPMDLLLYNEIVIFLYIIISILILFPARRRLLIFILGREDYNWLINGDFTNVHLGKYPLTIDYLLQKDFPAFMAWAGVRSGALILIHSKQKDYTIYEFNKRKLLSQNSLDYEKYESLFRYLFQNKRELSLKEESLPNTIKKLLKSLQACVIHPLVYKKSVLGLIIFHDELRTNYKKRVAEIFKYRASLIIQNTILSQRVIDARIYEQEFKIANRVQKALRSSTDIDVPGYDIHFFDNQASVLFEPFRLSGKRWLFCIFVCETFNGASGILVYNVLGRMYSRIRLREYINLKSLNIYLKSDLSWQNREHPIYVLFLELNTVTQNVSFYTEHKSFEARIKEEKQVLDKFAIINQAKSKVLDDRETMEISYQDILLLSIYSQKKTKAKNSLQFNFLRKKLLR